MRFRRLADAAVRGTALTVLAQRKTMGLARRQAHGSIAVLDEINELRGFGCAASAALSVWLVFASGGSV